jgi:hypothetical protein
MAERTLDELAKRVADPSQVTRPSGLGYTLAASALCRRIKAPEMKQKGFAIGQKLADPRVQDTNTRRGSIDVLVTCDPINAPKVLSELSKDKEASIAEVATRRLAELQKRPSPK